MKKSLLITFICISLSSYYLSAMDDFDPFIGSMGAESNQQDASTGIKTGLGIVGTLGAMRALVSLTAVNTAMHAYVIGKLHAVGAQVRRLTNLVKNHHAQNMDAHKRSQSGIDNLKRGQEEVARTLYEHVEKTDVHLSEIEDRLGEIKNRLDINDARQARRTRRIIRLLARKQQEHVSTMKLETAELGKAIGRVERSQQALIEVLERFSLSPETKRKGAELALKGLRMVKRIPL